MKPIRVYQRRIINSLHSSILYLSSDPKTTADQDEQEESKTETSDKSSLNIGKMKEIGVKKGLFSRYKQAIRALYQAIKFEGFKNEEQKGNSDVKKEDENEFDVVGTQQNIVEEITVEANIYIPEASEPSLLLSEQTRYALYASLPAIVQGRKWLLLYSTWRHGISLSTLYRKSLLWPGLSLLVVGDKKGAVFGGFVEAPLIPTDRKYQGSNKTAVFTNNSGQPVVFRPTGANRYFTLCSTDFLAIGGGAHFALYLESDLLNGSSAYSETYENPCLAKSQDFEVKEVELWGFVYGSKYDEIHALSNKMEGGICRQSEF